MIRFNLCSLIPQSFDRHYFFGDFDHYSKPPTFFNPEWVYRTSENNDNVKNNNNYHIIDFSRSLSLNESLDEQKLRFCDPQFIENTRKAKFAQLYPHGTLLHKGVMPHKGVKIIMFEDGDRYSVSGRT